MMQPLIMLSSITFALLPLLFLSFISANAAPCRFANNYTVTDVINNDQIRQQFMNDWFEMEQAFIDSHEVSLNSHLYTTYDGTNLNFNTGTQKSIHDFSAASKESLHLMYLLHAINDKQYKDIKNDINILDIKLTALKRFNSMFPGFGGFLPWFTVTQNKSNSNDYYIIPTGGWEDQTPALDNGQMYWGLYGLKWAFIENYDAIIANNNGDFNINDTLNLLQDQLNTMEKYAKTVFYDKNGLIRWVSTIKNTSLSPNDPNQLYSGGSRAGDPFEGELFQFLLDLKSSWNSDNERDEIWNAALNNLHSVNFSFKDENNEYSYITVQQGWHFSSHEQWKILELPYLDIDLVSVLFKNAEKVRTLNSDYGNNGGNDAIPGLYASVNGPLKDWNHGTYYVGNAGIPMVAYGLNNGAEYDTITPYGTMTTWLFNASIASGWLLNMMKGKGMQNIYGTTESTFINGTEICPMVTWDSKITSYIGAKGGIDKWTKYGLQHEGLYDRFINVTTTHYQNVFGDDPDKYETNHGFGIPKVNIPTNYLNDFENCK